jgi:hypothetical protein
VLQDAYNVDVVVVAVIDCLHIFVKRNSRSFSAPLGISSQAGRRPDQVFGSIRIIENLVGAMRKLPPDAALADLIAQCDDGGEYAAHA